MNEQEEIIVLGQEGGSKNIVSSTKEDSHRGSVVIAGIIGGFSGALIVAGLLGLFLSQGKLSTLILEKGTEVMEKKQIVTESDAMIVDTIEKSMPGVVSIIISKDVPKLQRFQSPFGGFPFFFENPLTFSNGLTRSGDGVKMGGALTENTRIYVGGTEVIYIDATTGNIAIGTTSAPTAKLDVSGTGRFTGTLTFGSVANIADNNQVLTINGSGVVSYLSTNSWDKDNTDDITTGNVSSYAVTDVIAGNGLTGGGGPGSITLNAGTGPLVRGPAVP